MKEPSGHPLYARESDDTRTWRADALGGMECLFATLTDFAFRPHAHAEFVIALTEAGLGRSRYRGAGHVVGPGDVIVLNPEEAHACGPSAEDYWTYRVLYPPADLIRTDVSECYTGPPAMPGFGDVVRDQEVAARLHRFCRLSQRPESSALEQEACLAEALGLLVSRHAAPHRSPRPGEEPRAVRRSREYLEEHARESVTLTALARFAGLSPFHLCRIFRKSVGMTPHAYQTQIRVRRAKSLLRAGLPINRVATEVGFYDQAHLTRHFKHIVGLTPGRYLKDIKG